MFASVDDGWLWGMAAAATVLHCSAMAVWIPVRRFRIAYPLIVVGCGAAIMVRGSLPLYAFALIGLTIGLFPTRRLFTLWSRELNEGARRERYDWPRSHLLFCVLCVSGMALIASALTR